ncbi:Sugar lactone lactonase YvrE [Kushneria avicenniae]|uniref:Sugar lactone lactonase YvrE n=1 Tax=Kushneria avicenniae TaxID=402385 RepID=A0A1I1KSF3_9GAMM|nr:SMP-30/gluconolactonase/LRE family protein [Kushneria avicenniae]SFC63739.1 Sugar lactone lactonase YvrE [Kushneria avicenniae]
MLEPHLTLTMALGEGPHWDSHQQRLHWVDILGGELHQLDPETSQHLVYRFDEPLAYAVPSEQGGYLAAFRSGLWRLDAQGQKQQQLVEGPQNPSISWCNDAHCDAHGRLWFGTKNAEETHPTGAFFSYHGELTPHFDGVTIANGIAISPNNDWLYFSDTPTHRIYRYPLDIEAGTLGKPELFADTRALALPGSPDGAAIDEAGHYWVAMYGGGVVVHFDEHGNVIETQPLLAPNPTKVVFGDSDLRTLYVTCARQELEQATLDQYPDAGSLFSMRVETPGLPGHRYRDADHVSA